MDLSDVSIGILSILIVITWFFLIMLLVVMCGLIVQFFIIDLLGIGINKELYWTGAALIILFATFCKASNDKE